MIPLSLERTLTREAQSNGFAYRAVDIDPLQWLSEQPSGDRILHHGPEGSFSIAGAGVADSLWLAAPSSLLEVESALMERQRTLHAEHPGWVGGVRFAPEQKASEEWQGFGAARFVLPERVVFVRGGQTYYGRSRVNAKRQALPDIAEGAPITLDYENVVERAIARLHPEILGKVVMATCQDFDISLNIESTLKRLCQQETQATVFWMEGGVHGFFGATPERLYRREGRDVQVDALAGTAALGQVAGQKLLDDDKERREHNWVKRYVVERLARVARVDADAVPHLFALSRLQHLKTEVRAALHEKRSLLSVLHPTPAVCGTPTDGARECINDLEGFDRGFYAGAFGCASAKGENFHVALRCALYSSTRVRVYGGAGIVRGSIAAREAAEVKRKTSALLSAIQNASDQGA